MTADNASTQVRHTADCDGFGVDHTPTAVPELHQGRELYRSACSAGCDLSGAPLSGSRGTAVSLACGVVHEWGQELCQGCAWPPRGTGTS